MGAFSIWHVAVAVGVAALLLGGGRISGLMADVGKGLGAFRKGLKDDEPANEP